MLLDKVIAGALVLLSAYMMSHAILRRLVGMGKRADRAVVFHFGVH